MELTLLVGSDTSLTLSDRKFGAENSASVSEIFLTFIRNKRGSSRDDILTLLCS